MSKLLRLVLSVAVIAIIAVCCVACNRGGLSAPVVQLNDNGLATWDAVEGAQYIALVDDEEQTLSDNSIQLEAGQSLRVKVSLNGKESAYSATVTYQHEHSWTYEVSADTLATVATCVRPATYFALCSTCGAHGPLFEHGERDAAGHDWHKGTVVAATCQQQGYTVYTCSRCQATEQREPTPLSAHNYEGVYSTYALKAGSVTCADGLVESRECTVCHAVDTRDATDGEHHCNHTVYDLGEYGCGCGGTAEALACPCGQQRSVVDHVNCTIQPISNRVSRCSECGFSFHSEAYESIADDCTSSTHFLYLYYLSDIDQALRLEYTTHNEGYQHRPNRVVTNQTTNVDALVKNSTSYTLTCARCGVTLNYGYEDRYSDGDTVVRIERGDYATAADGDHGTINVSVRALMPYGVTDEATYLETLVRTEVHKGAEVVSWEQTEITFGDAYCQYTTRHTDSKGADTTDTVTAHLYRDYGEATDLCAAPGIVTRRCVWCGNIVQQSVEPAGHVYTWDFVQNAFICLRCGNLSDSEEESVYLQDVSAQYNDGFYRIVMYAPHGEPTLSMTLDIATTTAIESLDLPLRYLERIEDGIRISIDEVNKFVKANGYNDYKALYLHADDVTIALGHVNTYSFAMTDEGLQRTATCSVCGQQSTVVLAVKATSPMTPAQTNGVFAYTFTIANTNTYRLYTTQCVADSNARFSLYDSRWRLVSEGVLRDGDQRYIQLTLTDGTYYVVPTFGGDPQPRLFTLHLEEICLHNYQYQFVQTDDVVRRTGECTICHRQADPAQWRIVAHDGLELQTTGAELLYRFTAPADSDYHFYCTGAGIYSVSAVLYDAQGTQLNAIASVEGGNFSLKYPCTAQAVYYVAPTFYEGDEQTFHLYAAAYCEHNYACTYTPVENGVRRQGACTKCGQTLPTTVIPMTCTAIGATLVTTGDDRLLYAYTPTVGGTYMLYFEHKGTDYNPFCEILLEDRSLPSEEIEDFYIAYRYELEVGTTYYIWLYSLGVVPDDADLSQVSLRLV